MRLKKAIKRLVALGVGATMMGATILGATAADLASYPTPFISGGKFDGVIVVGNDAKAEDVIGTADIISSLQYASTSASTGTTGVTTVITGDAWKAGTGTRKLELSENRDTAGTDKENIANITSFIDDSDLNALAQGEVTTDKGTAKYAQYLYFENKIKSGTLGSEYVMYLENDEDVTADFFYIRTGEQIARYLMEFRTAFKSAVEDSAGSSDTTGLYLGDYENEVLTIMGKDYEIVKARRTNLASSVELTLMGGAVKDTLEEGATKTYTIDGKEYTVKVAAITDVAPIVAKFQVNGEVTKSLTEGSSDTLTDGVDIGVTDIVPNEAGDVTLDMVDFYLGASKLFLKDTDISDTASSTTLEIGNEKISDADVTITGTNDNSTMSIDSIYINITADDSYFVPAGGKLTAQMKKPETLFNWDMEYGGLTSAKTEKIKLKTSGSDQYELEFTDASGYQASVPIAYTSSGTLLKFGDDDDTLFVGENHNITRNDYFIVSDYSQEAGQRPTYALRYKGADKSTDDNPLMKFDNVGDGTRIEKTHSLDSATSNRKATLRIGGASFNAYNVSSSLADDFDVFVDLDASGSTAATVDDHHIFITTKAGAQIDVSNATNTHISVVITTPDTDDYENLAPASLDFYINATGGEVRLTENGSIRLLTPESEKTTKYGYTSLGAFVTYTNPTNDPQELTIEYPNDQRTPLVYVTSGVVKYSATGGGSVESVTVQRIEVGAAKLASEVTNVGAQNLILVGGPCANSAAREVMGVTAANCAEGFEEGKAKIKLYEQSTGKVALLVAGYSAMDTRRASRVLANYGDYTLTGKEVEVSGTSLTDISVSAVA